MPDSKNIPFGRNYNIRPTEIDDFVGKQSIIKALLTGIELSKKHQTPLDHVLLHGPAGVGKTSLAQAIANKLNSPLKIVQASNIQKFSDLISALSALKPGDCIFMDEIHSLKPQISELLYPALEDNVLDIIIGKNTNSKSLRIKLPKFTLIAATTDLGRIKKSLEERFGYIFFLDLYTDQEMQEIIMKNCKKLSIQLPDNVIEEVIKNSRGTPRNCNRILKRVRDHLEVYKKMDIPSILQDCGYVQNGLTIIDVKYLQFLFSSSPNPQGLKTISDATNIDPVTISSKIEPYLIQNLLIKKGIGGRSITKKGMDEVSQINSIKSCSEN